MYTEQDQQDQQDQQGPMRRKPILMPNSIIAKVDRVAKDRGVSFAEVVRDVLTSWDEQGSDVDSLLVEALADEVIQTAQQVVERLDQIEQRLDATHKMIQEVANGRKR